MKIDIDKYNFVKYLKIQQRYFKFVKAIISVICRPLRNFWHAKFLCHLILLLISPSMHLYIGQLYFQKVKIIVKQEKLTICAKEKSLVLIFTMNYGHIVYLGNVWFL